MNPLVKKLYLSAFLFALAPLALADGVPVYSSIPNPQPPNLPSLGYEATSTAEFGGLIQFAGGNPSYTLSSATVAMSDWALASTYGSTAAGFTVPLTLNLYKVGAGNSVGSLIRTITIDATIPWRPEATAGCGSAYRASNGQCYNGSLSLVTFDLSGLTIDSDQIIYGLAFDTTNYGKNPTGVPGPYESLNFGLSNTAPSVGSNPDPGTAYWNTTNAGSYADGGAGGTGSLRQDANWAPYTGAIEFDAPPEVPEPSSLLLLGTGLLGMAMILFKRSKPTHAVLTSQ